MIEQYLESSALFSDDLQYRYLLTRKWERIHQTVLFIMLNPSTADEVKFDPTVKRCFNFAHAWGYGGLVVCNIFALRSTDPKKLKMVADPIGEDNDYVIERAAKSAGKIIAAWGEHGKLHKRGEAVIKLIIEEVRKPVYCLGLSSKGYPLHPLYLSNEVVPIDFKYPEMREEDY